MTREAFRQRIEEQILVCDGPLGRLLAAGGKGGEAQPDLPELQALRDGEQLRALHAESLEAGADLILTNTFAANRPTLEPVGRTAELPEIIKASLAAAQAACQAHDAGGGPPPLVGLVMGPLAATLQPRGTLPLALGIEAYREVVRIALERAPDLIVLDAMPDLQTVKAAMIAVRELAPEVPVAVQLAFGELGRTVAGTSPATALAVCRAYDVDLVGACGPLNPVEIRGVASMFARLSDLPIILQPHAIKSGAARSGKIRPNEFASQMKALLQPPVAVVGCWGSPAPHYPAHLRRLVKKHRPELPGRALRTVLCSESADVEVGAGRSLCQVQKYDGGGARDASPPAHKLHPAVRAAEVGHAYRGGEETRYLREAVPALQGHWRVPLLIRAESRRGLETALGLVEGRPLVWGAWLQKGVLDQTVPLVQRYGAALVAVTMSGDQPPRTAEDRVRVGNELIEELLSRGLGQENIVIDPVVEEIDPRGAAALEPLRALAELKARWGQPVLVRLSRLTHRWDRGRREIEAAYLAMAASAGVDLAVGEFGFAPLRHAALASSLLTGRDPGGRRFQAQFEFASGPARPRPERGRPSEGTPPGHGGDRPFRKGPGEEDRRGGPGPRGGSGGRGGPGSRGGKGPRGTPRGKRT